MLVRLMYASRAVAGLDARALQAIVQRSQAHNAADGITGVLCCSEGVFVQVLEGGRSAVSKLYGRIVADPRHADVELMHYEEIDERRFAGWAMGQVNLSRLNRALLLKYSETATFDPFAVSGTVSMAMFQELIETASITCPGS